MRRQAVMLLIIGTLLAVSAFGILAGIVFEGIAEITPLRGGENIWRRITVGLGAFLIASFFLFNGFSCWRKGSPNFDAINNGQTND